MPTCRSGITEFTDHTPRYLMCGRIADGGGKYSDLFDLGSGEHRRRSVMRGRTIINSSIAVNIRWAVTCQA